MAPDLRLSSPNLMQTDQFMMFCARVCQEETDEPLVDLGCSCRGELAKAHLSCIEIWFRTRGSNKCEICQQVAANVPAPESQPNTNYWIWRVDPAFGGTTRRHAERERRGCINPLWIAFCILIGGLLLDVLISVSFGVSALPVNIIIGALIVLGLGTAIRLALECCHEWNTQRIARRTAQTSVDPHYPPDGVLLVGAVVVDVLGDDLQVHSGVRRGTGATQHDGVVNGLVVAVGEGAQLAVVAVDHAVGVAHVPPLHHGPLVGAGQGDDAHAAGAIALLLSSGSGDGLAAEVGEVSSEGGDHGPDLPLEQLLVVHLLRCGVVGGHG
ncbi:hypothetical protein Taro_056352, partial [Colocasia esculenta]|nr:hypothetical protein [Colocasia esculenta]